MDPHNRINCGVIKNTILDHAHKTAVAIKIRTQDSAHFPIGPFICHNGTSVFAALNG
jgi:hypothetical protein